MGGMLLSLGLQREDYYTEEELRQVQKDNFGAIKFPTPDILLRRRLQFRSNNTLLEPCRWIDSKDTVLFPGCTLNVRVTKYKEQMDKYVSLFGQGVVIWHRGWAASLQPPPGVQFLKRDHCPKSSSATSLMVLERCCNWRMLVKRTLRSVGGHCTWRRLRR